MTSQPESPIEEEDVGSVQDITEEITTANHGSSNTAPTSWVLNPRINTQLEANVLLDRFVQEAQYEIEHDPYRGYFAAADDPVTSPWKDRCWAFGKTKQENMSGILISESDQQRKEIDIMELVAMATGGVTCPCLVLWTEEEYKRRSKSSRKRKRQDSAASRLRIGSRPTSKHYTCSCDHNPYCFLSLGGVIDEVLQERLDNLTGYSETEKIEIVEDSTVKTTKRTKDLLNTFRKSTWVKKKTVMKYLKNTLGDLIQVFPTETALQRIEEDHQALLFQNPLVPTNERPSELQIAVPPGIENLGATCYLNTQLQCLAQNPVFFKGILSWEPPTPSSVDRMSQILSLFQILLARLREGHETTVNTLEFSDALGLDHFEQQDPNEFSRLFFERIQENFKATDGVPSRGKTHISELLPNLFQGTMTYKTTCLKCKSKSSRDENFMDINLPIVKPPNKTILESFSSANIDTNVQYCWDQCSGTEKLEGENQYFCGRCNSKQNAERSVSFKTLPPILNLQLCRYVFDREKLEKKKLTEKVLLSKQILVRDKKSAMDTKPHEHRYVLCAVMKHKGTSAYRGHYVAEAMEWTTGNWFEFNDTEVKILDGGPSCSDNVSDDENSTDPKSIGSQDAYNLYYVDEDFLAQSVIDQLKRDIDDSEALSEISKRQSKVSDIRVARFSAFEDAKEMCIKDSRLISLLEERRARVREFLLSFLSSDIGNEQTNVFMDADMLRKYMNLEDLSPLQRELKDTKQFLSLKAHPCPHQTGIEPRFFRKCKIVPEKLFQHVYDSLVSEFHAPASDHTDNDKMDIDYVDMSKPFQCRDCSSVHILHLKKKLEIVQDFRRLLDQTETTQDVPLHSTEERTEKSIETIYAVERKCLTLLRLKVSESLKPLNGTDLSKNDGHTDYSEGVISFDDHAIFYDLTSDGFSQEFNRGITCSHGRLKTTNKKVVRFVCDDVWSTMKKYLADATEHPVRPIEPDGDPSSVTCQFCIEENIRGSFIGEQFCSAAKSCKKMREINMDVVRKLIDTQDGNKPVEFRVLHPETIAAWNRFLNFAKRRENLSDPVEIIHQSCTLLGIEEKQLSQSPDGNLTELVLNSFSGSFRSLICVDHMFMPRNLFSSFNTEEKTTISATLQCNNDRISIVEGTSYEKLLQDLVLILTFLVRIQRDEELVSIDEIQSEALGFCHSDRIVDPAPILISSSPKPDPLDTEYTRVGITFESLSIPMYLAGSICDSEQCNNTLGELGSSTRSTGKSPGDPLASLYVGSAADNPICLEHPNGDMVGMRIFLVNENATDDEILKSVAQSAGIPDSNETDATRRSSRRRKSRNPVGSIEDEQIIQLKIKYNVAGIRLTCYEECRDFVAAFELDHTLSVIVVSDNKQVGPVLVKLDFEKNAETLEDVIKEIPGYDPAFLDLARDVMMVRKASRDPSASGRDDMETLLTLSNISSSNGDRKCDTKTASANYEKGFRDTFLSKGPSIQPSNNGTTRADQSQEPANGYKKNDFSDEVTLKNGSNAELDCEVRFVEKPKLPPKTTEKKNGESIPSWEDDSSDDEWLRKHSYASSTRGTKRKNGHINRKDKSNSTRAGGDENRTAYIMDLCEKLIQNDIVDGTTYQNEVYEASSWAIPMNLNHFSSVEDLLDQALAKYLELVHK